MLVVDARRPRMKQTIPLRIWFLLGLLSAAAAFAALPPASAPARPASPAGAAAAPPATLADLLAGLRDAAKGLESSAGMRLAFPALTTRHGLPPDAVPYADFAVVRLVFEATRDAGLWNLQWRITDREPRSDAIWRQWRDVGAPSPVVSTATAECDELSALFAFLARELGIHGIGLFWPYSNHTVAVWQIRAPARPPVRVVVPTTQIFLAATDRFGTDRFDPWNQRAIHEYVRRDAARDLRLPAPLLAFFLDQAKRYGGATDETLQRLRYLRAAVFQNRITPGHAALLAGRVRDTAAAAGAPREDLAALAVFAVQMRAAEGRAPAR
jgi:hypothetical protein